LTTINRKISFFSSTVAAQEESDGESSALPPGWKELVDKKTGRAYYVNRSVSIFTICIHFNLKCG